MKIWGSLAAVVWKTLSIKNTKYEPFQTINAIPLCMVKKQSRPPFSLKNVLSKENFS